MNKKIIVTGGCGYIGSHTVVMLQQAGYEVVIIDNLSNSKKTVVDAIEKITKVRPIFEEIDLREKTDLEMVINKHQDATSVIHFAAFKAVYESVQNPLSYYQNNIVGLINLLDCVKKHNINKFVFSSSCTVYGVPNQLPVSEEAPLQKPSSPYGNTKKIGEEILEDFAKISGVSVVSLRYFNPIGAHESALIGELPQGVPNNLLPYITQVAVGIREHLSVFGDDYDTRDGTAVRDYIHVVDLAEAHLKACEYLEKKKKGENFEAINLGSGDGYTVMEIVKTFEKIIGKKLNYKIVGRRDGDVPKIFAAPKLAKKLLDWETKSDLENMIASAWKWELNLRKQTS